MKERMFDEVTKALATATSRRQALKAIGVALGGALGLGRMGMAFADQCKPLGTKCFKHQQCCSNFCQNGVCASPCTPNGGSCTQDSDCCAGICDTYTGTCGCAADGINCKRDIECCSGVCNESGRCGCESSGTPCRRDLDCCSGSCVFSSYGFNTCA
jgi:hypothetical protein